VYASKTRKEKFSGPDENCQRYVTDLAGSLVTSSRPPGRLRKRRDGRTWNAGVAVRTADGSRRTADAGDELCLRCGCSSPSCTVVLCAADVDGPLRTACTAPPRNVQPVQLVVQEMAESAVCVSLTTRAAAASTRPFRPAGLLFHRRTTFNVVPSTGQSPYHLERCSFSCRRQLKSLVLT